MTIDATGDGQAAPALLAVVTVGSGIPSDGDDALDSARRLAEGPGTAAASAFVRQSPDDPDSATFGSRGLVLASVGAGAFADPSAFGDGILRGHFAPLSSHSERPEAPDLHAAAGILVAMVDNADTADEAGFTKWYETVHMRDVTGTGGFWGALRYRNVDDEPEPGSSRYLAVYVTDMPDVLAALHKVTVAAPGMARWHASIRVHVAAYRRLG
jgi:hypothetical protein